MDTVSLAGVTGRRAGWCSSDYGRRGGACGGHGHSSRDQTALVLIDFTTQHGDFVAERVVFGLEHLQEGDR